MTQEDNDFIQNLKMNKILIEEKSKISLCNYIDDKINVNNVILYSKLADVFNSSNIAQLTLRYMERCFTIVAETKNFLELDFVLVKTILRSSELHITSELEVLNAANKWINYNIEERRKFSKHLLLTVRLPLLSDAALNSVLRKASSICNSEECISIIQNVLLNRENFANKQSMNIYTNRYCNQTLFNILFRNQSEYNEKLKQINANGFKSLETFPSTKKNRKICNAVCLKGNIYIFVRIHKNLRIKKYVQTERIWKNLCSLDKRSNFCACGLIDNIFVIGGNRNPSLTNSCIQYNTKNNQTNQVARMSEIRGDAACTIFGGKIVVSGGVTRNNRMLLLYSTNSVEVYDHIADAWSYMPDMMVGKRQHSLVAIKSKLFVIARHRDDCEVFDKFTKKFVVIKSLGPCYGFSVYDKIGATSIGNQIAIFQRESSGIVFYDTDKDECYEELNEDINEFCYTCCISCFKMPQV